MICHPLKKIKNRAGESTWFICTLTVVSLSLGIIWEMYDFITSMKSVKMPVLLCLFRLAFLQTMLYCIFGKLNSTLWVSNDVQCMPWVKVWDTCYVSMPTISEHIMQYSALLINTLQVFCCIFAFSHSFDYDGIARDRVPQDEAPAW